MGDVLIQPSLVYNQHRWIEIKIEKKEKFGTEDFSRKPICEALSFEEIFNIVFCVLVSVSAEDQK